MAPVYERLPMLEHDNKPLPPQRPTTDDPQAWHGYWEAHHQPWRTEPEIDAQRQEFLTE